MRNASTDIKKEEILKEIIKERKDLEKEYNERRKQDLKKAS